MIEIGKTFFICFFESKYNIFIIFSILLHIELRKNSPVQINQIFSMKQKLVENSFFNNSNLT
ncbi:hypothetical protein LEP1GSC186_2358 [Leptospira noguchii serovar Autumnalis str. ZUN142]|uniref:Uncharacterized protein n=1 Tax=Leptospira noguchii serovar Autumnalis str. ZUN142 TaxID=1085540 RepID=M6UJY8_9LEPT|nr:hypothetical protein LEP1GSC186_2358 [Leptospira noguchii serovar Autumnalis str. ZUN142]